MILRSKIASEGNGSRTMVSDALSDSVESADALRTAKCGPACLVVWGEGVSHSLLPDLGFYSGSDPPVPTLEIMSP